MHYLSKWLHRAWPVLLVATIIISLDQWTKELIRQSVVEYTSVAPIPALGNYLVFERVRNYGAAFGILQNQSSLFAIIAVIVGLAILVYVYQLPPEQKLIRVLLGLQLGGAMGNLIDRLTQLDEFGRGYVTDFIRIGLPGGPYWPNFNVADSAIVTGVIGLGIYVVWDDIRRQRLQEQEQDMVKANSEI